MMTDDISQIALSADVSTPTAPAWFGQAVETVMEPAEAVLGPFIPYLANGMNSIAQKTGHGREREDREMEAG